tara:strand:+ start:6138 stop:6569 length:432 start_codon:yes stop_codon:yes gene_type:complete
MSKKIKVNTYCKSFASISFLNNKKKIHHAHFKLFPFLRKKVKGLEHYSYVTISNNQYKKLITLEKGGRAPVEPTENNIGESRCSEIYEQTNKEEYFDDFNDIDDWYPFDEPYTIIIHDEGLNDILKDLFNKLEKGRKDEIDNK